MVAAVTVYPSRQMIAPVLEVSLAQSVHYSITTSQVGTYHPHV